MMEENQRLAVWVLWYVFQGKNVDQALLLAEKELTLREVNLGAVKDYTYGVLRYGWQLKFIVKKLCKKYPSQLIENLLLIALYQLLYTNDDAFTIVSQAVNTAAKLDHIALKGFVNAVLRTFLREKDRFIQVAQQNEEARYNHPQWWINKIKHQYPLIWEDILKEAQQRAPFTLRVNTQQCSVEEYVKKLNEAHIDVVWVNNEAIILATPCSVDKLPGFDLGMVSIQDASAQLALNYIDLFSQARVLDACAAPGGKTCHLLEHGQSIELLALDKSEDRLQRIWDNIKRLKLSTPRLSIKAVDARDINSWWDGVQFDRILLDAPCTGSGVVRRHPDIKWLRRESDISQLVAEQEALLNNLWPLLKPQGKLVYVTCSIFKEETSEQIQKFLKKHTDAKQLNSGSEQESFIKPDSFHDGFYYAVCQKN
ncbi:MAG: 16S rRNA (cytosine(967)-C(5))-methyltransferase RsmB [Betaproteobacteria bacterium]|nr:16S rRNA (cytosine(967)-C(5))-methyltransferase RsmB [Betaproteobacteria bacterium]MDE2057005.1 16S rRNA (cytosine(967)-C(5))-methyltransferase RsmB [Betaproteobacteria bacterium]